MRWQLRVPIILICIGIATGMLMIGQSCSDLNNGRFVREEAAKQSGRTCFPPAGVSGSPKSVEQVVALINALAPPVSLPCLVEALDRPLKIYASQSSASIQPSSGPDNPRFFIFSLPLIMTITTDGVGASRMEMSVLSAGNTLSTKAELQFPITSSLSVDAPYARVYSNNGTTCKSCHQNESLDSSVGAAAAYMSNALKPLAASEVDLNFVQAQYTACNPLNTPDRCLLLKMLFEGGHVVRQDFPVGMQSP